MSKLKNCILENNIIETRPKLPKRAVVTAGMPYGSKELHFGHIGGCFIHADTFSRFLRDRLGSENVIFVSGTDCYGSPILVNYRLLVERGEFNGSLQDFVKLNHQKQKETLERYNIAIDLFSASSFGISADIHRDICAYFFNTMHENGYLSKNTTSQFYDSEQEVFLNGRQVVGHCPIQGCASDRAYADECALGHQYVPADLINPKSTLSGKTPEMRDVTNWYFDLESFLPILSKWTEELQKIPGYRPFIIKTIEEFFKPPLIYIKKEFLEQFLSIQSRFPVFDIEKDDNKSSFTLTFRSLEDRDIACKLLTESSIRYRTGKTIVPFRLTGNTEWGVPAPVKEGLEGLTFWVWPESLFAPISFTKTFLENADMANDTWEKWWCAKDSQVYQFIGSDCIYFYGPAEMAMFLGIQGKSPVIDPEDGHIRLPIVVANNHILFLDKKASSSSDIKPPMANDLLEHYMPEQLRNHFLGLGLGIKSVSFQPKPLNPGAGENDADPVLKEGNLLTNVFNRVVRSCFYTVQQYYNGRLPFGEITRDILYEAQKTVVEFEQLMCRHEFHSVMNLMDNYIRSTNKYWVANMREADANENDSQRKQTLVDVLHMVRTSTVLMHSIAPEGTEMILEYLSLDKSFWDWNRIFETVYDFMQDPETHKLKHLEPRVDFFKKHSSQLQ